MDKPLRNQRRILVQQFSLAVATLSLITACGGGGGSATSQSTGGVGASSGSASTSSGSSSGASSGTSSGASSGASSSSGTSSGSGGSSGLASSGGGTTTISITGSDAARLADQAAFGPTPALVAAISAQGSAWIDAQIATPSTGYATIAPVSTNVSTVCPSGSVSTCYQNNFTALPVQIQFFHNALYGADQLRQRVALAYSQIFVISSVQIGPTYAIRNYEQMLLDDAFVNFRQIQNDVTLSAVMGSYLNMANNNKGNAAAGISPNENYAREVMQLFSIGPNALNPDGSLLLDSNGNPVPTYSQDVIEGFASTFTGWTYPNQEAATTLASDNYTQWFAGQMIPVTGQHDAGSKLLLNNFTQVGGQTAQVDLQVGLDNIFNHPNVGPFIGKQLIQFLVTSNPSPGYVSRIAAVFNNDGTGTRGNMAAVIKAILLDVEARGPVVSDPNFGKLREPVVDIVAILRAINATSDGVAPVNVAASMGQPLFGPETVFSYYPPSYPLPNSSSMVGPQFGILNTASALARLNFLNQLLFSTTPYPPATNVTGSTGTQIDLSVYQASASDPATMVQLFNTNLLHGAMTAGEASAIVTAVNAIPSTDANLALDRTRTAAYLVFASPRYQITR